MTIEIISLTLLSGIVSGVLVGLFQHLFVWRRVTRHQIKKKVFDDAILALAKYEVDTMDAHLQSQESGDGQIRSITNLTPETKVLMSKSLALVPAYFSKEASVAYNQAYNSRLGLDNIPNPDYYTALEKAMALMVCELGPRETLVDWCRLYRDQLEMRN